MQGNGTEATLARIDSVLFREEGAAVVAPLKEGLRLSHGARMYDNRIEMPRSYTFDEWVDILTDIGRLDNARQWAWADALLAGQDRFGEDWEQALSTVAALLKKSRHTIENWVSVGRAWPSHERPDGFPFSIAAELCKLKRSPEPLMQKAASDIARMAYDEKGQRETFTVENVRAAKKRAVYAIKTGDADAVERMIEEEERRAENKPPREQSVHVQRARVARQVRHDIAGLIQHAQLRGETEREATEAVLAYLWIDVPVTFVDMIRESRLKGESGG